MSSLEKSNSITKQKESNIHFGRHVKYEHLIAGISGGVSSTLILHPLDLLKIRFEVNNGVEYKLKYDGIFNGLRSIYKDEGIKGLYRGTLISTIGAGASWGIYFFFYNAIKVMKQDGKIDKPLLASQHLIAASQAGFLTLICTNPLWVCKTRLCLQYSTKNSGQEYYTGIIDTLSKLYKKDGLKGWYRGFIPGTFGVSHGAIQFMAYEEMKNMYSKRNDIPISAKLGVIEYLSFAAFSKVVAVTVTYPYQVIKARMQNQFYLVHSATDCIKQTWIHEGWKGFYKGLGTNILRVVPATMITFATYENVSHFLMSKRNSA